MSRRKRAQTGRTSRVGADDALDAVVAQFADPLVFLRELVQNSLDASATRIDVNFSHDARSEVAAITVIDNGEGMNERIIDNHLLTLFSSSKENDLTKIGKFGIGFKSIFAIEPDLVVVDTGQAGEAWRVLFHPDRSFEKLRLDQPVEGTTVTLHKKMEDIVYADLREKGAATVRYWCKYAEADVRVDGTAIAEEFGVGGGLVLIHEQPGTSIAVGFVAAPAPPLIGFYNRGLTLIEDWRLPHDGAEDLVGLNLRVKSRYLEHTLSRDNVRDDESYEKVIDLVREVVADKLRPALIAHLGNLAAARAPELDQALSWAKLPSMKLHEREQDAAIIPTVDAGPVSLRSLRKQDWEKDTVLFSDVSTPLSLLLLKRGLTVIEDREATVEFVRAAGLSCGDADGHYFTTTAVELIEHDAALLERVDDLLDAVGARAGEVHLGDLDYPGSPLVGRLHVRQRTAFGLSELAERDEKPGFFGGPRQVVLAARHPLVSACRAIAGQRPELAAMMLAVGIALAEGIEPPDRLAMALRSLRDHRERTEEQA